MRAKRWIGWTLPTSLALGLGLAVTVSQAIAADGPDELVPPPPMPRPKVALQTNAEPAPKVNAGELGLKKIPPIPSSEMTSQTGEQDRSGTHQPVKTTEDGQVMQGVITFSPPPAIPARPTGKSEMSPYRVAQTPLKAGQAKSESPSPYPTVIPAAAKASQPSPVWGSYNRPQPPKPTTTQQPVRRDQPTVIQGFKPAEPAMQPQTPTGVPGEAPVEPIKVTAAQLQQRVIVTCGQQAQKVNILAQANSGWVVEIAVRSVKDADEVSAKVLGLKEMLASNAALKLIVSP